MTNNKTTQPTPLPGSWSGKKLINPPFCFDKSYWSHKIHIQAVLVFLGAIWKRKLVAWEYNSVPLASYRRSVWPWPQSPLVTLTYCFQTTDPFSFYIQLASCTYRPCLYSPRHSFWRAGFTHQALQLLPITSYPVYSTSPTFIPSEWPFFARSSASFCAPCQVSQWSWSVLPGVFCEHL